jgi:hypothetical protein
MQSTWREPRTGFLTKMTAEVSCDALPVKAFMGSSPMLLNVMKKQVVRKRVGMISRKKVLEKP